MSQKILLGVRDDIESFTDSFISMPELDYNAFSVVWKRMKFDAIFSGRRSVSEVKYFTQQILNQLKERAIKTNYSNKERICSVFLLYGLYHVQPLKDKIRIRIEHDEWQDLSFFIKSMRAECVDVVFCFNRLWRSYAFDFVQESYQASLEALQERMPKVKPTCYEMNGAESIRSQVERSLRNVIEVEPELKKLEDAYNDVKREIAMLHASGKGLFPPLNFASSEATHIPKSERLGKDILRRRRHTRSFAAINEDEMQKKSKPNLQSNRCIHIVWKEDNTLETEPAPAEGINLDSTNTVGNSLPHFDNFLSN